jgi:hypothetical protein
MAGFGEHGNEPSDSKKGGKFLDCLCVLLASQVRPCSVELVNKAQQ